MKDCRRCIGGKMCLTKDEDGQALFKCVNCGFELPLKKFEILKKVINQPRRSNMSNTESNGSEKWRSHPSLSCVLRPENKTGWKHPNPLGQPGIGDLI